MRERNAIDSGSCSIDIPVHFFLGFASMALCVHISILCTSNAIGINVNACGRMGQHKKRTQKTAYKEDKRTSLELG